MLFFAYYNQEVIMPVRKVGKKWAIGRGKPIYTTKKAAEAAYAGYRAQKHSKKKRWIASIKAGFIVSLTIGMEWKPRPFGIPFLSKVRRL